MNYVTYLNLPDVPPELLDNPEDIIARGHDPMMPGPTDKPRTKPTRYDLNRGRISDELHAWLKTVIRQPFLAQYQFMDVDLPMHVDRGRYSTVYLLQSGGEQVETKFYDENHNVVESVVLPTKQWAQLAVHNFHSVDGIENGNTRFALSIRSNDPIVL
jgi:hypothetical protein